MKIIACTRILLYTWKLTNMFTLIFLLLLGDGEVAIIWKCFPCDFRRANELFTNKCLQITDHKGVGKQQQQQLVCRSSRMDKLIAINPLPRNKDKMQERNARYAFMHSKANCRRPRGKCSFPHSHIEAEAWNVLLYGCTPQQKVGARWRRLSSLLCIAYMQIQRM